MTSSGDYGDFLDNISLLFVIVQMLSMYDARSPRKEWCEESMQRVDART
jgi:hypothetical protein